MANQKQKKTTKTSHVYHGCREAIQGNNPGSAPQAGGITITTGSTGVANYAGVFAPMGLTSVNVTSSGGFTQGTIGNLFPPTLRGLYLKATGFQWYRVTRAKLIFVGNVGSTTAGNVVLAGYTDPSDVNQIAYAAFVSGPNTKVFDLASTSSREASVPLPVDSSWKRCSSLLTTVGNVYPYNAANAACFATVNTVADLSFGAWAVYVTGAGATVPVGSIYLDYDVEFKGPIDPAVNT